MQRWHAFRQLILARIREFYREPEALFWVYGFPLILAVGLGIAFSNSETKPPPVDVQEQTDRSLEKKSDAVLQQLRDAGLPVEMHSKEDCKSRMQRGHTNLYLVVTEKEIEFHFDKDRPEGVLARWWVESVLLRAEAGANGLPVSPITVSEPGSHYIDFLLPGLIGMNIMGGGLFGLGFVLVDMRVRKLFKRLLATPMRRGDFLLSLLTARLLFLAPEMLALLLLGRLVYQVPIKGSLLCLFAVILLGALAFSGIGLLAGCRTEKTETISGLINLVMLPMYLLSGIFFSSARFPQAAQPFIQALPLTQLNDALREVMLEGASLEKIGWRLLILAAWAGVTFALALRWFRWR